MENAKTIRDFLSTAPLSDGDYLPVYQPDVFNVLTQRNGDTRKITASELANFVITKQQKDSVGDYHFLSYQPTPLQLAKKRYLVLNYQIIEIALYQDLCDLKWVGASANASAYFWYKCDAGGTRNASGLYMRVEDGRGMFYRGAGANAVFTAANGTPYDGNVLGSFIGDAIRDIEGQFSSGIDSSPYSLFRNAVGAFSGYLSLGTLSLTTLNPAVSNVFTSVELDVARVVPTAHENRPGSLSYLACISY